MATGLRERPAQATAVPDATQMRSALENRRLVAGAAAALVLHSARYWIGVAPLVRTQLRRFEQRARAIPDPRLRALALEKLRMERFNAETAAMLATLAPRAQRADVVEAIVAYELLYDYLDGLTEPPAPDPLRNGRQLLHSLIDAVTPDAVARDDYYRHSPHTDDGRYLQELVRAVQAALVRLPAAEAIGAAIRDAASRCAEAQVHVHAGAGSESLQAWAVDEAQGTALEWRVFLAGAAASVLTVHALIAAAADPQTTRAQAEAIDTAYLSISALGTMLDSLIDYERDAATGEQWFVGHYDSCELLARELAGVARRAAIDVRALPHAAHHVMLLVGAVTYFTSAPTPEQAATRALLEPLHRQLQPLTGPTLAYMRAWRAAKRMRQRLREGTTRTRSAS
jgi:tetraprenyl-beta-curcumene synthase